METEELDIPTSEEESIYSESSQTDDEKSIENDRSKSEESGVVETTQLESVEQQKVDAIGKYFHYVCST